MNVSTRSQLACLLHTLPHRRKMQLGEGENKNLQIKVFKVLNGYGNIDSNIFKIKACRVLCVPGFTMNVSSWPNFLLRTLAEARFAPSDVFVDVSWCDIPRGRARLRLLSLAFQRCCCHVYVRRIASGSHTLTDELETIRST